jgi:hypothetical protein
MGDYRTKRNVAENTYKTSLTYKEKFPVGKVEEIIREVLAERLGEVSYQSDQSSTWTKEISDEVKNRIKGASVLRWPGAASACSASACADPCPCFACARALSVPCLPCRPPQSSS